MLSLKYPVNMAMRGHLKIAKNHFFAWIFSIQKYFKVLQLLKGLRKSQRLFSVGYTLPYDRPGVIVSLSQVQNLLGHEGTPPSSNPHHPSDNTLMYLLDGGRR
jgi:hypothetical protein